MAFVAPVFRGGIAGIRAISRFRNGRRVVLRRAAIDRLYGTGAGIGVGASTMYDDDPPKPFKRPRDWDPPARNTPWIRPPPTVSTDTVPGRPPTSQTSYGSRMHNLITQHHSFPPQQASYAQHMGTYNTMRKLIAPPFVYNTADNYRPRMIMDPTMRLRRSRRPRTPRRSRTSRGKKNRRFSRRKSVRRRTVRSKRYRRRSKYIY